ncbi:MAG: hypothetical protein KGJ06_03340 [Pseudomonadota bacterium]|nr:hypothetical protein [Pseudomonadota bacterium]
MSETNIPLTEDEVKLIVLASALLNRTHTDYLNAMAGIAASGADVIGAIQRAELLEPLLSTSKDLLMEVRRAVTESPRLTTEELGTLKALRSFPQEASDMIHRFISRFAQAEQSGANITTVETLRHGVLGTLQLACQKLDHVMKMIDKKIPPAPFSHVDALKPPSSWERA